MNEERLKQEVINVTCKHIIRQGTRRVNMDQIAREMGISKRTLYIMFNDKRGLVGTCVNEIKNEYSQKVNDYLTHSAENSLQDLRWILREYLRSIYSVDYSFLIDMKRGYEFNEFYKDYQFFWQQAFEQVLQRCREEGYILDNVKITTFTKGLLEMINKSRTEGVSFDTQKVFCDILLRGIRQEEKVG